MKSIAIAALTLASLLTGCTAPSASGNATPANPSVPDTPGPVSFKTRVAPVLKNSCGGCHTPGSPSGGVVLFDASGEASYPQVVVALDEIIRQVETGRMPRGGKPRLTASEVAALKQWRATGAADD